MSENVTPREAIASKKQKNGGRFKIAECNMTGRISSIFAFFTSLHKNGSSSANFEARPLNLFANQN